MKWTKDKPILVNEWYWCRTIDNKENIFPIYIMKEKNSKYFRCGTKDGYEAWLDTLSQHEFSHCPIPLPTESEE